MIEKDYIAIAEALNFCNNSPHEYDCISNIVDRLCFIFKLDNPNFKSDEFKKACGLYDHLA